ncbi:purine and uridine phosphorylase, partial [Colletotrichum caudatum]
MSVDSDRDSGGLASLSTNSSGANFVPDSTPGPSEGPFEYTAGWICGFDTEFTAAKAFLEKTHTDPPLITPNDRNSHACGRIGSLNVVIAMPPDGEYGAAAVATLAENMLRNFPHLRMGLMVGIGGGAPSSKHDVRLGDVVVSHKDEVPSGILHLDLAEKSQVKAVSSDDTDPRLKLSVALKEGIARMQDFADMDDGQMDYYIDRALERLPPPVNRYSRPPRSSDRLYRSDFLHLYLLGDCGSCGDDPDRLVSRETREKDAPAIHYGVIATSGRLISDASVRDNLAEKGILCFDLLAAGLQNYFPCVVIRGICDYLDSHRTQEWHGFASITAAAYAARLLRAIDPKSVEADVRMVDTVSPAQPNSETTKQNLATVENRTSGIDEDLEHEIRLWLSPPDPSTNLEEARAAVIEGTGAWFLEGDTFSEWKSGKMQQLFLFGNPGSGKTLLSTMLVDHLRQDTGSTTIFFFFDSRDTGKQTFDSLLRSLAWQLYRTEIRSRKRLRKFHSNCRSNICRSDTRELAVAVKDMMRLSGGANIVIDAVDECTTADEFLWWLESFYSTQSLAIFKFIVTGRPTLELLHRVPTFFGIENCLALAQDAETFNITRTYVDKRLKEDQSFVKKSLSQDLVDAIRIRVEYVDDGRFRWTVCQLDILAICGSPDAIRSALENMPRTLDEAYRYVLQNIPDNHRSDVIRLLQVLVHLSGPLTSSAATDIMATRIDTAPPGFEDHVRLDSGNDLLRNYPSLVPFISPTPNEGVPKKIQLSNSSVRDILLGEGQFQRATGDITITLTALAYMKDIKETPEKTLEDFPFAELAAGIINVFTKHAEADDGVFSEILSFSRNPAALHRWYRCLDRFDHISDPPTPLSPLYFPCRAGLLRAVIRLLQDGVDVNEGNG